MHLSVHKINCVYHVRIGVSCPLIYLFFIFFLLFFFFKELLGVINSYCFRINVFGSVGKLTRSGECKYNNKNINIRKQLKFYPQNKTKL